MNTHKLTAVGGASPHGRDVPAEDRVLLTTAVLVLAAVVLLPVVVGLTVGTAYVATDSWLLTVVITSIVVVGGAVTGFRHLTNREPGLIALVPDGVIAGLVLGAVITGHAWHALATGLAYSALVGVASLDPTRVADYLIYAWWTPAGIRRRAVAKATLDAVHRAQQILEEPQLDGASTTQLLTVLARDRRNAAASVLGEPPNLYDTTGTTSATYCSICGTRTDDVPCREHQPLLFDVHLELAQRREEEAVWGGSSPHL